MNTQTFSDEGNGSLRGCAVTRRHVALATWMLAAMFHLAFCSHSFAQSYSIDWFTIDGGGGTSTGGVFSVSGTIGQPDAGPRMAGGSFSIDGGFWGIVAAVPTPGAPLLSIFRTATNTVIVSWPSPSPGFNLQVNGDLSTSNWVNAGTPSDNGTNKFLIVNPPIGNRFFRLSNP